MSNANEKIEAYATAHPNALMQSVSASDLDRNNLYDLSGQVAIVTGGGSGLGLVTAICLAQNGAKVYITGRRQEPLQAAVDTYAAQLQGKGSLFPVVGDMATKAGIEALRDTLAQEEGFLNILVCNHGVSIKRGNLDQCEQSAAGISREMYDEESFEKWNETYRINTSSMYFLAAAFLPLLADAEIGGAKVPGTILNLSSISGMCKDSQRGQFSYNCSKAAVLSLTQMLATEFAGRGLGVRVNAIVPGHFPSGMGVPAFAQGSQEEQYANYRKHLGIPFGRPGTAREYAQAVLSIVCNTYMTGANVLVDGGYLTEN